MLCDDGNAFSNLLNQHSDLLIPQDCGFDLLMTTSKKIQGLKFLQVCYFHGLGLIFCHQLGCCSLLNCLLF